MTTIFRYDVFHRRHTVVVVPHALFACGPQSLFTPHQYIYDPKKGGLPVVQAVKSAAMFNNPEIQSCAVCMERVSSSWLLTPHPVGS